jgi:hypothetical protein
MRTIRRQVYARDRRLALLQLRQGKCRCTATVRTFAGCPRRGCASPTRRIFRPVVARISRKPYLGLFEFPAFALHHFLFCVATKITQPLNRISIDRGTTWQRPVRRGRLATPKEAMCPKSDAPPPNKYAADDATPGFPCFRRRSTREAMPDQRITPAPVWHAPCDLSLAKRDRARFCERQTGEKRCST